MRYAITAGQTEPGASATPRPRDSPWPSVGPSSSPLLCLAPGSDAAVGTIPDEPPVSRAYFKRAHADCKIAVASCCLKLKQNRVHFRQVSPPRVSRCAMVGHRSHISKKVYGASAVNGAGTRHTIRVPREVSCGQADFFFVFPSPSNACQRPSKGRAEVPCRLCACPCGRTPRPGRERH
jgi:hypothetical protein